MAMPVVVVVVAAGTRPPLLGVLAIHQILHPIKATLAELVFFLTRDRLEEVVERVR